MGMKKIGHGLAEIFSHNLTEGTEEKHERLNRE
jgi:hypothetical protein